MQWSLNMKRERRKKKRKRKKGKTKPCSTALQGHITMQSLSKILQWALDKRREGKGSNHFLAGLKRLEKICDKAQDSWFIKASVVAEENSASVSMFLESKLTSRGKAEYQWSGQNPSKFWTVNRRKTSQKERISYLSSLPHISILGLSRANHQSTTKTEVGCLCETRYPLLRSKLKPQDLFQSEPQNTPNTTELVQNVAAAPLSYVEPNL